MMRRSQNRDGWTRFGLAAAALLYACVLVFLPAHGHDLARVGAPADAGTPEQPAPDRHLDLDCFLCQLLAAGALPESTPALAQSSPVVAPQMPPSEVLRPGPQAHRSNARAPPA